MVPTSEWFLPEAMMKKYNLIDAASNGKFPVCKLIGKTIGCEKCSAFWNYVTNYSFIVNI